jgi:hypothetical protein
MEAAPGLSRGGFLLEDHMAFGSYDTPGSGSNDVGVMLFIRFAGAGTAAVPFNVEATESQLQDFLDTLAAQSFITSVSLDQGAMAHRTMVPSA